jgi:hypothetical protein
MENRIFILKSNIHAAELPADLAEFMNVTGVTLSDLLVFAHQRFETIMQEVVVEGYTDDLDIYDLDVRQGERLLKLLYDASYLSDGRY